jgi:hypothetical protein
MSDRHLHRSTPTKHRANSYVHRRDYDIDGSCSNDDGRDGNDGYGDGGGNAAGGWGGRTVEAATAGEGEEEDEKVEEEVDVRNSTVPNFDIDTIKLLVDMRKKGDLAMAKVVERHSRQDKAEGIVMSSKSCSP